MSVSKQDWLIKARHDFQYSGDSVGEIAKRYGRGRSTLAKAMARDKLNEDEWVRETPATYLGGRRKHEEMKPLSAQHLQFGSYVNYWRTVKNDWTVSQAGARLSPPQSRFTVRNMELGFHDFTLMELTTIAGLLEVPLPEMLFGRKTGG